LSLNDDVKIIYDDIYYFSLFTVLLLGRPRQEKNWGTFGYLINFKSSWSFVSKNKIKLRKIRKKFLLNSGNLNKQTYKEWKLIWKRKRKLNTKVL